MLKLILSDDTRDYLLSLLQNDISEINRELGGVEGTGYGEQCLKDRACALSLIEALEDEFTDGHGNNLDYLLGETK